MVTPRPKNKASRIAWAILGKPENMKSKKTAKEKAIDVKLSAIEMRRGLR